RHRLPALVVAERLLPFAALLAHLPEDEQRLLVAGVARDEPLEHLGGLRDHARTAKVHAELQGDRGLPLGAEVWRSQQGFVDADRAPPLAPLAKERPERDRGGDGGGVASVRERERLERGVRI